MKGAAKLRRTRLLHTYLVMIVMMLLALPVAAQARSFVWERWDVVIDQIETSANRFRVAEIYRIRFRGTYFFGTADIPTSRVNALTDFLVYEDGQALSQGCPARPGTYCVTRSGDTASVEYRFRQPVTDRAVEIRLEYTVEGGLRSYEGGDQLYWMAVTDDHAAAIENSVIVVNLPPDAVPREGVDPIATYGADAETAICASAGSCGGVDTAQYVRFAGGAVVVARSTRGLRADEPLEIRIQYPHNPSMSVPPWQPGFDQQREFEENILPLLNLGGLLLSIVIAVGGSLAVIARYYIRGRDPSVGLVPEYLTEPPSDLLPALAGTLVDERADMHDILATLIDLASRGYLVIEESRTTFLMISSSEFTLKRTDRGDEGLTTFEKALIRAIFSGKQERKLSDLKNKFYKHLPGLKKQLYDNLVRLKYFPRNPDTTRSTYAGVGIALIALSGFAFFLILEAELDLFVLFALDASIAFVGLMLLIFSSFMPAKTEAGALEAAKWRAFRNYLENLSRYATVDSATEQLDKYLAYAVAFQVDKKWLRHFEGLDQVPVPIWYYPTYRGPRWSGGYTAGTPLPTSSWGGSGMSLDDVSTGLSGGLESLSSGLTRMLNDASSTLRSSPSSSGSGGFSGGGGGGRGGGGGGSRGFG